MNTAAFSSLVSVVVLALILGLTHLIVKLTFPSAKGYYRCPRRLRLDWFIVWLEWTKPLRKLVNAIHVGAAFLISPAAETVVFAPQDSWALLQETLEMDARSHAFDQDLRLRILKALARITVL
jgi:hypothetical protein